MQRVADKSLAETCERFWGFVEKHNDECLCCDGCWHWRSVLRKGYGRFKIRGRYFTAHRLAYEWLVGPIPEGLTLDHGEHCGNRACVNPSHLEVVTLGENTARSNRRRLGPRGWNCGHSRTPENIYTRVSGAEECRSCRRAARQRFARKSGRRDGRLRPDGP